MTAIPVAVRQGDAADDTQGFSPLSTLWGDEPLFKGSNNQILDLSANLIQLFPLIKEAIQASLPQKILTADITPEIKRLLSNRTLELMRDKKDNIMAILKAPGRGGTIKQQLRLKEISVTPGITQAVNGLYTQMQLQRLTGSIEKLQGSVDRLLLNHQNDMLAMCHSCRRQLEQAVLIKNPALSTQKLLQLTSDCENARSRIMETLRCDIAFVMQRPTGIIGQLFDSKTELVDERILNIRTEISALNQASLIEARAYQALGETEAMAESLLGYGNYLKDVFIPESSGEVLAKLESHDGSSGPSIRRQIHKVYLQTKALSDKLLSDNTNCLEEDMS